MKNILILDKREFCNTYEIQNWGVVVVDLQEYNNYFYILKNRYGEDKVMVKKEQLLEFIK